MSWLHTAADLLWNPCLDLLLVSVAARWRSIYYLFSSAKAVILVLECSSQASPLSCSSPCPLSSKRSPHLSPLSSTPPQDKQPLFWGTSAICSKEHTRSWMLFRSGRKMFKILFSHSFFPRWSMIQIFLQIFHNFILKHTEMLSKKFYSPHNCFLDVFLITLLREFTNIMFSCLKEVVSNVFELHSTHSTHFRVKHS